MPPGEWNHAGTKQGIYLFGPRGEFLEGQRGASTSAEMLPRFERAIARWRALRAEQRYADKPVPSRGQSLPPEHAAARTLLRVSMRDLPSGTPEGVVRWRAGAFDDAIWATFLQWAWNQDWHAIADPRQLLPVGSDEEPVDPALTQRLFAEVFVDRVRGQAPPWQPSQVREADLRMRRVRVAGAPIAVVYAGNAALGDGERGVRVRCYGRATFDAKGKRVESFELVGVGLRHGAHPANQRAQMLAPSPIGFALRLHGDPVEPRGRR